MTMVMSKTSVPPDPMRYLRVNHGKREDIWNINIKPYGMLSKKKAAASSCGALSIRGEERIEST